MQDLVGGIRKILQKYDQEPAVAVAAPSTASSADPLVKRGFLFLEDREFDNAKTYRDAQKKVDDSRKEGICRETLKMMNESNSTHAAKVRRHRIAEEAFSSIRGYKDADERRNECLKKADEHSKEANNIRIAIIAMIMFILSILGIRFYISERNRLHWIHNLEIYSEARQNITDGKYEEARDILLQFEASDFAENKNYYPDVRYNLGLLYEDGKGAPRDIETARRYFTNAAGQGHADAQG